MTPERAARWTAVNHDLRSSCGCETGAWFMGVALVAYPPLWYWWLQPHLPAAWAALLAWAIGLFLAAAAGKLTGLLAVRARLEVRMALMQRRLSRSAHNG
jgi:hypothetical protein